MGFRRSGFKFPPFQPESYATRVECFALIAGKAVLRKSHMSVAPEFASEILPSRICNASASLWKSIEEMSLIFWYEHNGKIAVILRGQLKADFRQI